MANPEGSYLAWLDCRQAAVGGDPFKFFLEKAVWVGLNDGKDFGRGGEGFVPAEFWLSVFDVNRSPATYEAGFGSK